MKIAAYLYRRKSALLKGLVLGCTVWLTVTVLLFMEDRRITPASNDGSAGLFQQEQQPSAQRLAAARDEDAAAAAADDNRPLDDEFPLEGGVEQQQPAAVVAARPQLERTSSRRSHRRPAGAAGSLENGEGVLPQPRGDDRSAYGEMGKPVVLPANLSADVKALVDEGWKNNAFNQYASDLVSLHRSLPDPRDEW